MPPVPNLNDPNTFLRYALQLGDILAAGVKPIEVRHLKEAIGLVKAGDWHGMSETKIEKLLLQTGVELAAIGPPAGAEVVKLMEGPADVMLASVRRDLSKTLKVQLAEALPATQAATYEHLRTSQSLWVSDQYGVRAEAATIQAKGIVEAGMKEGLTNRQISKQLTKSMAGVVGGRSPAYYDTISTVFANRSRTYANLATYQELDIRRYQFQAILDERTCLAAGTLVSLADGTMVPIETVRPDDEVLSCKGITRRVVATMVTPKRQWGTVLLSNGEQLRLTPNHPILTEGGWVRAGRLSEGDRVVVVDHEKPDHGLQDLWQEFSEGQETPQVLLGEVHPELRSCASVDVQGMRRGVLVERDIPERRTEDVLLGGMSSAIPDMRMVQGGVQGSASIRGSRPVSVLLESVPPSRAEERHPIRGDDGGLHHMREELHLRPVHSCGGQEPTALLDGMQEEKGSHSVRGVRGDIRTNGDRERRRQVLQRVVLSEAHGGDQHRGDGQEIPGETRDPVRAGDPDRTVVGGLSCGRMGSARGGRGILALARGGDGSRREEGCSVGAEGVCRGQASGERHQRGSALRDPGLDGLGPFPRSDIATRATCSAIVEIDWELTRDPEPAYDLQVEHDAGFIAAGIVVHNSNQCRFMHGKTGRVDQGLRRMEVPDGARNPQAATKLATPWMRQRIVREGEETYSTGAGKTTKIAVGDTVLYIDRPGGKRLLVARIDEVGTGSGTGSYARQMPPGQLQSVGLVMPPLHGRCRSSVIPI